MAQDTWGGLGPAAIREQAKTVLASQRFTRSARGSALLSYLVDETLAGRGDRISATTIAQDVLDKDAEFDSGSDPLVRVQMGRMRALLASWYDDHADEAEVCISIPKGNYRPSFEPSEAREASARGALAPPSPTDGEDRPREPRPDPAQSQSLSQSSAAFRLRPGHVIAACLLFAIGALGLLAAGTDAEPRVAAYPVVMVRPFENLTGDAGNDTLSRGLQRQLASDLQRFKTVRVAVAEEARTGDAPGRRMAARHSPSVADYALSGTILSAGDELDFTVDLTDLETGALLDRRRLRGNAAGDYYGVLTDLSQTATGRLLGGGGTLDQAALGRLERSIDVPAGNSMNAFRCLIVFDEFTRAKTADAAGASHDCLTKELSARPRDSTLLAALAWTRALVSPEAGQVEAGRWADGYTIEDALALAERAVAAGPGDDFAHEHLALLQWRSGQREEAVRSLRRALALNPGNPHLAADLALYLGFLGQWDEAMTLADQAYERSGDPPNWYALPRYYRAVLQGEGHEAMRLSRIVAEGDPYGPIYELVAAVTAGDEAAIAASRPAVERIAASQGGDPLAAARPWIRSERVLGALEDRLAQAGVTAETS